MAVALVRLVDVETTDEQTAERAIGLIQEACRVPALVEPDARTPGVSLIVLRALSRGHYKIETQEQIAKLTGLLVLRRRADRAKQR